MNALRDHGTTHLNLRTKPANRPTGDHLLEAVREAAGASYEVYGAVGHDSRGRLVFLARELASGRLAAIAATLTRSPLEYVLELVDELDASVVEAESRCPFCKAKLREWGRFCPKCGKEVGRGAPEPRWSSEELLEAAQAAASGRFEILGEFPRAGRGGVVYFARDLDSGEISALRLKQDRDDSYWLGRTRVLNRALRAAPQSTFAAPAALRYGRRVLDSLRTIELARAKELLTRAKELSNGDTFSEWLKWTQRSIVDNWALYLLGAVLFSLFLIELLR